MLASTLSESYDGSTMSITIEIPQFASPRDYRRWREAMAIDIAKEPEEEDEEYEVRLYRAGLRLLRSATVKVKQGLNEKGKKEDHTMTLADLIKDSEKPKVFASPPALLVTFVNSHTLHLVKEFIDLGNLRQQSKTSPTTD